MAWLRDVRVPEGKKFADVVDPLLAVITRGSIDADGVREADLLAHMGWAYFLKSRDAGTDIDPARSYGQALAIDPDNPYAHAFWGHWIIWQRGSIDEANRHFAAALASGREREVVRGLQLPALRNYTAPEVELALLRAVDEMRRNGELVDEATRRYVSGIYFAAFNSDVYLRRILGALPPQQHIETIRALYFDEGFDQDRIPVRDALIALLQEEAGDQESALASWREVRKTLGPEGDGRVADQADAAVARLAPGGKASRTP
jgi:tetratricopeptide (TPR) repeat protein